MAEFDENTAPAHASGRGSPTPAPESAGPSVGRRPLPMFSAHSAPALMDACPMVMPALVSRALVHRNKRPGMPLPSHRRAGGADQFRREHVESPRHAPAQPEAGDPRGRS